MRRHGCGTLQPAYNLVTLHFVCHPVVESLPQIRGNRSRLANDRGERTATQQLSCKSLLYALHLLWWAACRRRRKRSVYVFKRTRQNTGIAGSEPRRVLEGMFGPHGEEFQSAEARSLKVLKFGGAWQPSFRSSADSATTTSRKGAGRHTVWNCHQGLVVFLGFNFVFKHL